MDCSVSSVYYPVTDNDYIPQNSDDDDTGLYHILNFGLGDNYVSLFVDSTDIFRVAFDHSVEVAAERIFRLVDVHVLSHLKIMTH